MDCGPTCLKMIAEWYGKSFPLPFLREKSYITREGVSILGISEAADYIGFRTIIAKLPYEKNPNKSDGLLDIPLPCIAYWYQRHFIVVYKANVKSVWIADPAQGRIKLSRKDFEKGWIKENRQGIVLALETSPKLYQDNDINFEQKSNLFFLFKYLRPFRKLISHLLLAIVLLAIFQVIFPFLTQAIVDVGIQNKDIGFIYLILIAQLVLFISQTAVKFVQSWILLQIGTRVNVSLITDFLTNLMKLPIGYFDSKMTGDLMQRIGDNKRIENFLMQSSLSSLFSVITLLIFSAILLLYSPTIFFVFFISSALYLSWIVLFLKRRKEIDYLAFQQASGNQQSLFEIINGMQEIKLQGSEKKRRWGWLNIQAMFFKIKIKSLLLNQYQESGANFINQVKDIIIIFIAAKSVVEGSMTLGMMIAVQYIIGQLNAPLLQLVSFIQNAQDAKISLERLQEIQQSEVEDLNTQFVDEEELLKSSEIIIKDLSFKYTPLEGDVLKNVNLNIPNGKTTAIVGTSGSGKTTLLKLILGFYKPTQGKIFVGEENMNQINKKQWRKICGTVMQDGYIFSDTIENNIAESDNAINRKKLDHSAHTANIKEFIENLPLKYKTKIGLTGNGISQGQKQRLLIARAVYKNPSFIFFDEATNALDANNERIIMENLESFLISKTVIVVAHRLSTVKNADQIIVLEKGRMIELGTHDELVSKKGAYFTLVKNQLELAGG